MRELGDEKWWICEAGVLKSNRSGGVGRLSVVLTDKLEDYIREEVGELLTEIRQWSVWSGKTGDFYHDSFHKGNSWKEQNVWATEGTKESYCKQFETFHWGMELIYTKYLNLSTDKDKKQCIGSLVKVLLDDLYILKSRFLSNTDVTEIILILSHEKKNIIG